MTKYDSSVRVTDLTYCANRGDLAKRRLLDRSRRSGPRWRRENVVATQQPPRGQSVRGKLRIAFAKPLHFVILTFLTVDGDSETVGVNAFPLMGPTVLLSDRARKAGNDKRGH